MNRIYIIIILSVLLTGSSIYNLKHYKDADNLATLQNDLTSLKSELDEMKNLLNERNEIIKKHEIQWKNLTKSNLSTNKNDGASINDLMK